MNKVKVLVVDDSAMMRKLLSDFLSADPQIEVVGTAPDGEFALRKIPKLKPDVITLDLQMPNMDGFSMLKALAKGYGVPVIMVSAHTREGAEQTLKALDMGAVDFIHKPGDGDSRALRAISRELQTKVRIIGKEYRKKREQKGKAHTTEPHDRETSVSTNVQTGQPGPLPEVEVRGSVERLGPRRRLIVPEIVVIGTSTGGPNALSMILPQIPSDFNLPIVVTQHMPPGFTKSLSDRINKMGGVAVKEAEEGDLLKPGRALIAPGGKQMEIKSRSGVGVVKISSEQRFPDEEHAPSINLLFRSTARIFGARIVAVIMTGMGTDGAEAMKEIYNLGGFCIVQDEATSVVWGMPKAAIDLGAADVMAPAELLSDEIIKACKQ